MQPEFYNSVLYPLQDKAVEAFKNTDFYLTGGTTLSRGYYGHRFSDDLDYFLNDHPDFGVMAERAIKELANIFDDLKIVMSSERFYRLFVAERQLKIEMINDVPSHIGALVRHPELGLIDSRENILANKVTAVVDRGMPKDIADIYFLLKDGLSLKQALLDADSKAAGIAPLYVAKTLSEYDYSLLDTEIRWVVPIDSKQIRAYLTEIAVSIVRGKL